MPMEPTFSTFADVDREQEETMPMSKTQSVPAHVYSAYQRRVQEEEDDDSYDDSTDNTPDAAKANTPSPSGGAGLVAIAEEGELSPGSKSSAQSGSIHELRKTHSRNKSMPPNKNPKNNGALEKQLSMGRTMSQRRANAAAQTALLRAESRRAAGLVPSQDLYRAGSFADSVVGDDLYPTRSEIADFQAGRTKSQRPGTADGTKRLSVNPNGKTGGSDAARMQAAQQQAVNVAAQQAEQNYMASISAQLMGYPVLSTGFHPSYAPTTPMMASQPMMMFQPAPQMNYFGAAGAGYFSPTGGDPTMFGGSPMSGAPMLAPLDVSGQPTMMMPPMVSTGMMPLSAHQPGVDGAPLPPSTLLGPLPVPGSKAPPPGKTKSVASSANFWNGAGGTTTQGATQRHSRSASRKSDSLTPRASGRPAGSRTYLKKMGLLSEEEPIPVPGARFSNPVERVGSSSGNAGRGRVGKGSDSSKTHAPGDSSDQTPQAKDESSDGGPMSPARNKASSFDKGSSVSDKWSAPTSPSRGNADKQGGKGRTASHAGSNQPNWRSGNNTTSKSDNKGKGKYSSDGDGKGKGGEQKGKGKGLQHLPNNGLPHWSMPGFDRHVAHIGDFQLEGDGMVWEKSKIAWHEEALRMGELHKKDTLFVKGETYDDLLSTLSESQIRHGGCHRYCIRFRENTHKSEGFSMADGIGFVFSNKLPCAKNIQRIQSLFISRKGIVCIRRKADVTRCKEFSMRPFSDGDYIFCEIDLQAGTCAFWLEGPDSYGRTLGPPSGARFSYAACFPQFQVGKLDMGFISSVIKYKEVAAECVGYWCLRPEVKYPVPDGVHQ